MELGAYWSIRTQSVGAFERYMSQLQAYYFDFVKLLPPSQRMYPLLGLNLLHLLAQNRISDFHAQLERIDADLLLTNVYIKHPVQLEQCLMEGSYNKVLRSRAEVPAEEYLFFMDMLMDTIRNEIAGCSEVAYESLPIQNASSMLFVKDSAELMKFCQDRRWIVNAAEKKIYFGKQEDQQMKKVQADEMAKQLLGYAIELERIV